MNDKQPRERRTCALATCKKRFRAQAKHQRFCSSKCRWQEWFNNAVERAAQAARDNSKKGGPK